MVSFFKVLGIGYALVILALLWEILELTFHAAAVPYVLPFTVGALIGFVVYFLFVYLAPTEEEKK